MICALDSRHHWPSVESESHVRDGRSPRTQGASRPGRRTAVRASIISDGAQNQQRVGTVDEIDPRIPLKSRADGVEYQIIVGFQLTPEEIEWNRTRKPR